MRTGKRARMWTIDEFGPGRIGKKWSVGASAG
jgi:hypothetical protein